MLSRKDMMILVFDNTKSMSRPITLYNDAVIPSISVTATDISPTENKINQLSSLTLLDGAKQVAENLTTGLAKQKTSPLVMMAKTGKERSCILSYIRSSHEYMLERLKLLQVEADQPVDEGMSYSITLMLDIVNKYRLQAQVDRFGCGFAPWQVHPVHLIVFTDSKYCAKGDGRAKIAITVPEKKGGGVHINDFISEPYRWDQKIFFFILLSELDTEANFQPSAELVKIASRTGGDVFVCKNLDEALESSKDLQQRICPLASKQSVVVMLALDRSQKEGAVASSSKSAAVLEDGQVEEKKSNTTDNNSSNSSKNVSSSMVDIYSNGTKKQRILYCDLRPATGAVTNMQWPIPEGFDLTYHHNSTELTTPSINSMITKPGWSKLYRESYCDIPDSVHCVDAEKRPLNVCRTASPTLHLCQAGNSTPSIFMRACEVLNISVDKYILTLTPSYQGKKSSPFFNNLLYKVAPGAKNGCVVVYVKGKNNSGNNYTTVCGNPPSFPCGTCGFIQARTPRPTNDGISKAAVVQVELVLLPYNFHILFPLLLMGVNMKDFMGSEKLRVWRHNINVYLQSTPAYYHVPLWQLLSQLDLIQMAALPPVAVIANKVSTAMQNVHNMVKMLEQNCVADLIAVDSVTKYEGYSYEGLTTVMTSRPVHITALQTPVERELELVPPSLHQIHTNDLLFSWEHMRKHLYGGTGKTVKGIFFGSDQLPVERNYHPSAFSSENWFSKAVGGSLHPQKTSAAMGNYVNVLARKEGLRNPHITDVPPFKDENHPSEILRRKVSVNFGNRYRIGGSEKEEADLPDVEKSFVLEDFMEQASSMESSHRSESNGNGREDCTSMDDQSESSTALISVLRETANLYCDSPFPTSLGSNMMEADFFVDPICNDKLPPIGGFAHQETAASSSFSTKYEIPFIQRPPTRRVSKRKQQELSQDSSALPSHDYKDIHSNDSPRQDESEDLSFMIIEESQRKRSHIAAADTDIDADPFKEGEALNDCQLEYLEVEMEGDDDDDDEDESENESESESNSFQNASTVATIQELPPILLPDSSTSLLKPKPLHEVDRKVDLTPIACGIASSIPQSLPLLSSSSSIVHATSSVVSTPLLSPSPLDSREEKLPPGWVKCISKREGRAYWFNSQTGQSSWALPR